MDEYNEYEVGSSPVPSRRFQPVDIFVLLFDLLRGIASAFVDTFESAFQLSAAHANWRVDRGTFHEEAALEIETLTTGDEDG